MPSLTLFGQRTPVAGDDLRIYAVCSLLLRTAQLGASVALLIYTNRILQSQGTFFQFVRETNLDYYDSLEEQIEVAMDVCLEEEGYPNATNQRVIQLNAVYLTMSLFLAAAGIVYAIVINRVSGCGTPTNGQITIPIGRQPDRQRNAVLQGLCHIHLTMFAAFRLASAILGWKVYAQLATRCKCIILMDPITLIEQWNALNAEFRPAPTDLHNDNYGCKGKYHELYYFLMCSHLMDIAMNALVIAYVSAQGFCSTRAWRIISKKLLIPRTLGSETQWRLFCRCCCTLTGAASCFLLGGKEAALGDFTEIAMLLSDYFDFHGVLDITATDLVAAMLLLGEVQTQRIHSARKHIIEKTQEYNKSTMNLLEDSEDEYDDDDNDDEEVAAPSSGRDSQSSLLRRRMSNYSVVRVQSTDIVDSTRSADATKVMRQVIRRVKTSHNFDGINYRLKRYEGAEWKWEAQLTKILDPGDATDLLTVAEGARFMRLALAIYTWVMYSFNRPCTGCCKISCLAVARECSGKPKRKYFGDGQCCHLHSTSFLREAGITDETEVLYAYFHSGVVEAPFAVVLDHEWKSVVIVIRGTLSLEDILTDLTMNPTNLEDVGRKYGFDGSETDVHGGMLATSEWVLKELSDNRILEDAFAPDSPYANYRLRITGHSLGAGVAAIIAMMIRPKYPNLRCHSFSPPGCVMSENAARASEEFITGYILNSDIVPRASLTSLDNLRHDLVDIISRIKVPKNKVMEEFTGCNTNRSDKSTIEERLLYDEKETPRSRFTDNWKQYRQLYDDKKMKRGSHVVELFPPGRLVQIFPSLGNYDDIPRGDNKLCLSCICSKPKKEFSCRWASRLDFREIRISKHFVDDHIPLSVLTRLEEEAERFGLAPPYVVEVEESTHNESASDGPAIIRVHSIFSGNADELKGDDGDGVEITYGRPKD